MDAVDRASRPSRGGTSSSGSAFRRWPRQVNNGDSSLNYTQDTVGQGRNGSTPQIPDRVNGGFIADDLGQIVRHEQIYGDPAEGRWTKIAYHVSLKSSPGMADGTITQWIDDEQTLHNTNIPWIGPADTSTGRPIEEVLWNVVAIGGNDYFGAYPASERHEEWYAIDDVVIATELPAALLP